MLQLIFKRQLRLVAELRLLDHELGKEQFELHLSTLEWTFPLYQKIYFIFHKNKTLSLISYLFLFNIFSCSLFFCFHFLLNEAAALLDTVPNLLIESAL